MIQIIRKIEDGTTTEQIIIISPSGVRFLLGVNDAGELTTEPYEVDV